ncbi:MAG: GNAT family N-acetyltransferase [Phycisphaerales bacterium]|nr:GNAT family N-acetyltransferase [Phycisphaerales bacterium]
MTSPITVRHDLRPGDLGSVVRLHGTLYASEYGFDPSFEAYVAGPMAEFVKRASPRDRLWVAERGEEPVGCIAIVGAGSGGVRDHMGLGHSAPPRAHGAERAAVKPGAADSLRRRPAVTREEAADEVAQLRWFLVHPSARGAGLGRRLLTEAVEFARLSGYPAIHLWTVSALTAAAQLYRTFGFAKAEERPGRMWGVNVVEEKYVLELETV